MHTTETIFEKDIAILMYNWHNWQPIDSFPPQVSTHTDHVLLHLTAFSNGDTVPIPTTVRATLNGPWQKPWRQARADEL